jgi:hypothetical protein
MSAGPSIAAISVVRRTIARAKSPRYGGLALMTYSYTSAGSSTAAISSSLNIERRICGNLGG